MQLILSLLKYHSGSPQVALGQQALPRRRWSQLPRIPQQGHAGSWAHFKTAHSAKSASVFLFVRCDRLSCACGAAWLLDTMAV